MVSLTDLTTSKAPSKEALQRLMGKPGDQRPNYCFQCARCTSGCPAMELLELSPHHVVNMVRLGFVDELVGSKAIWGCAMCLTCKERCPQEVAPVDVILALRNLAVEAGVGVPEGYMRVVEHILEDGRIQPPQEVVSRSFEAYTRQTLNLPFLAGLVNADKFRSAFTRALETK